VLRNPAGILERTLARRIRQVAEAKDKPLYIVAELAGFSRPALWAILNQQASATLNSVERIATALGVAPLELLKGTPAPARARKAKARKRRAKKAGKKKRRAAKQ
jgi:transcriptional regulator with XRE-family HTH domain